MSLISVIVPVYNVEKYLRRCLDSIVQQTHSDLEIILVDDGSTDESGSICDEYKKNDSRIIVIHKVNEGPSTARNVGIDMARGKYIGFVDSDDYIVPEMYERLLSELLKYGGDYSTGGLIERSLSGRETTYGCYGKGIVVQNKEDALIDFFVDMKYNRSSACCKLFKREIIAGDRFTPGTIGEDIDFLYRIIEKTSTVVCINTPVYCYVHSKNSRTTSTVTEKAFDMIKVSDRIDKFFGDNHPELMWVATVARFRYILDIRSQTKRSSDVTGNYARTLDRLVRSEFKRFALCHRMPISSRFLMFSMAGGVFDYVFPICDIILKILNNGS